MSKRTCYHASVARVASDGRGLSAEASQQELDRFLGIDGRRKLTCISRLKIPEQIELTDRIAEYKGAVPPGVCDMQRNSLLFFCSKCLREGGCSKGSEEKRSNVVMFAASVHQKLDEIHPPEARRVCPACAIPMMSDPPKKAQLCGVAAFTDLVIVHYHCSQCSHQQAVDGSEQFLLRKQQFKSKVLGDFELCFSWHLLYDALSRLRTGDLFYHIFVSYLSAWKRYSIGDRHLCAMQSIYRHFKEAIMDCVDLMQLPYLDMRCTCSGSFLIADGVACGTRNDRMCCFGGWLVQPSPTGELMPAMFGSDSKKRFVLREKEVRAALRPMTRKGGGTSEHLMELQHQCDKHRVISLQVLFGCEGTGIRLHQVQGDVQLATPPAQDHVVAADAAEAAMPEADHNPMADTEDPDGAEGLTGFLSETSDNKWVIPSWAQAFFRLLGADSPALALVPLADIEMLQQWRQKVADALAGRDLSTTRMQRSEQVRLRHSLPALQPCLSSVLSFARRGQRIATCVAVRDIVTLLIEVCSAPLRCLVLFEEWAVCITVRAIAHDDDALI